MSHRSRGRWIASMARARFEVVSRGVDDGPPASGCLANSVAVHLCARSSSPHREEPSIATRLMATACLDFVTAAPSVLLWQVVDRCADSTMAVDCAEEETVSVVSGSRVRGSGWRPSAASRRTPYEYGWPPPDHPLEVTPARRNRSCCADSFLHVLSTLALAPSSTTDAVSGPGQLRTVRFARVPRARV